MIHTPSIPAFHTPSITHSPSVVNTIYWLVTAADSDGDAISLQAMMLPEGGEFKDFGNGVARLEFDSSRLYLAPKQAFLEALFRRAARGSRGPQPRCCERRSGRASVDGLSVLHSGGLAFWCLTAS